jgi:hypothetical protein
MRNLVQSTAANVMVFMTDSADHIAGKTGLTLTITASKDGAAFASISPSVTERGDGWYNLALTTSHTDTLGDLALHVTSSGADPSDLVCRVIAFNLAAAGVTVTTNNDKTGYTASTVSDKTGYSLAVTPPTASTIASQVRTELTTELGRIDAAITTRLAAADYTQPPGEPPSAESIAGAVRTELTTELGHLDADVSSRLADADYEAPDNAGIDSIGTAIGALNDLSAADVNAEVDAALADIHLDHLLATTYDPASKPGAADALLNELVESDGGVARFTQNALEQAPGGAGGGSATIENQEAILAALNGSVVLAPGGLDLVDMSVPVGGATNFAEAQMETWRDDHRKKATDGEWIVRYADDGTTPITSQRVTFNRNTRTVTKGPAE